MIKTITYRFNTAKPKDREFKMNPNQSQDTVIVKIDQNIYSDTIHVLIPPKYWATMGLSELIAKAIKMTTECKERT